MALWRLLTLSAGNVGWLAPSTAYGLAGVVEDRLSSARIWVEWERVPIGAYIRLLLLPGCMLAASSRSVGLLRLRLEVSGGLTGSGGILFLGLLTRFAL